MAESSLLERVRHLVQVPTAPFREHWVCHTLDRLLAEIPGLEVCPDRFGNRIVRLRRGESNGTPVIFVAHLDHPGFIFSEAPGAGQRGSRRYEAVFEGRVEDSYFPDTAVRLYRGADDPGIKGRIVNATPLNPETDNRRVTIETEENGDGAVLGMWDVPVFEEVGGRIRARVCDDLVGCAAVVEGLARLSGEAAIDVAAIFSRAEEAGFCGVISLLAEESLPSVLPGEGIFVSVEISSEVPGISIGDGALIRIGDRTTTFDNRLSDSLWEVSKVNRIKVRRALMDGGTCEASAFAQAGYRAGGICAPLRNYHNMDKSSGTIAPEIVALEDIEILVELITGLARTYSVFQESKQSGIKDYELLLKKGHEFLTPIPLHTAQIVGKGGMKETQ